ncbi:MAG: DedA family protein [Desulfomicrobium escambiense]|nr:DedA family protein [Desulfomicrobium escambiense]
MRLFSPLYRRAMTWSRHRHAPWYLGGLSFAESSFFPIPPDVMLAPMCLARPERAWQLAWLTTLASVAGGLAGYAIGYFAFDAIEPWLRESRYWAPYQLAVEWFHEWGFWAVFVAGFSPIPYKAFTIAAGVLSDGPAAVHDRLAHRPGLALLPRGRAHEVGRGAHGGGAAPLYRPSRLGHGGFAWPRDGALLLPLGRRIRADAAFRARKTRCPYIVPAPPPTAATWPAPAPCGAPPA